MPRTFTRAELRTRLEQLTDTENDTHLATSEKDAILNSAMAETWDEMCNNGLGEKFVKSVTFNTVANQVEYPFATVAPTLDLYRIHKLYSDEGQGQFRALQKIQSSEILNYRAPNSVVPMKLYYIPISPIMASGGAGDILTFDGINGWEEHTLMTAAIAVCLKKGDSYQQYMSRKKELEQRMAKMGNIDFGEPARVSRKRTKPGGLYYPYFSQIDAYAIRGDKIELYYSYPWVR